MTVWIEAPFDSLPTEGYRKQRYWLMAEAFVAAGHTVVYWTSDFSHATKKRRVVDSGVSGKTAFRVVLLPTRPYRRNIGLSRVLSHRAYAKEWERQALRDGDAPDVMIVATPPVATGDVAIRLARRFGAKLVVDVQDAWPETFYRLLPRGFRWLGWLVLTPMRRAVRRLYRAADLVTGVCDRYEALVKGCGAKEYYRAYLGIEVPDEKRKASEWNLDRVARTLNTRLVYVGNLGKSYDLKTVVTALEAIRAEGIEMTLDVAGFGTMPCTRPWVRVHGMLERADLYKLLLSCEIGVIPMRSDSFVGIPNKLGEYAAAGLTVVSSLAGETAELLREYRCGETYRPGDPFDFVRAVCRAKLLPAGASRRLCEEVLEASRIYRDYVRKVLGGPQPAPGEI